ncbi:hypothetical protein AYO49_02695 [Verrucomicrobiaceae bacterium SCGC AG-212-N21]|nr:hypothetical protein AYO49_02695 [Verrucomicrobiaceae bacterium SCGC AG-212-N21]
MRIALLCKEIWDTSRLRSQVSGFAFQVFCGETECLRMPRRRVWTDEKAVEGFSPPALPKSFTATPNLPAH